MVSVRVSTEHESGEGEAVLRHWHSVTTPLGSRHCPVDWVNGPAGVSKEVSQNLGRVINHPRGSKCMNQHQALTLEDRMVPEKEKPPLHFILLKSTLTYLSLFQQR